MLEHVHGVYEVEARVAEGQSPVAQHVEAQVLPTGEALAAGTRGILVENTAT